MEFIKYEPSFDHLIKQYYLSEEQMRYTAAPIDCIPLSNEDSDRHSILAIHENELVTFFVLHESEGVKPYSDNENAILLRAFSTNNRHQGKGYAKQALNLLPQYIQNTFPNINEIVLAVNVQNKPAKGLYEKAGFIDQGIRRMGPKGELIIMHYSLDT